MRDKCIGIIAEYNPFHAGHAWQLEQAKKNADTVIVVMSGDFTQRGLPAVIDKRQRAITAIKCGADMVIEIPVTGSCASAEAFARCGIGILDSIGIVDTVLFGAENPNPRDFTILANALENETFAFKRALSSHLKTGLSYPKASSLALSETEGIDDYSDFLSCPNNILGTEYVKALKYFKSKMDFMPIKRQSDFLSSTEIRNSIKLSGADKIKPNVPEDSYDSIAESSQNNTLIFENDFSMLLHLTLIQNDNFEDFLDGNKDLSAKIINTRQSFVNIKDFADKSLKSKNITHSRIMRYLTHILLGITYADLALLKSLSYAPYAKLLAVNSQRTNLLSDISKYAKIPVIKGFTESENLPGQGEKILYNKDMSASDIYRVVATQKSGTPIKNERSMGLIKVNV